MTMLVMLVSAYVVVGIVYALGECCHDEGLVEAVPLIVGWPFALMHFPHGFRKFWEKYMVDTDGWHARCFWHGHKYEVLKVGGSGNWTCSYCGKEQSHGHRQDSQGVESAAGTAVAAFTANTPFVAIAGASAVPSGGAVRSGVEIVAWRAWNLGGPYVKECDKELGYLWSTSHPCRWDGPVQRADLAPARANTHGIYAVKELGNAPLTHVWGQVALSGVVVEGEDGYRGEVATIRSLFLGRRQVALDPDGYHAGYTFEEWPDAALVAALEARYKVDVAVVEPRLQPQSGYIFVPQGIQIVSSPVVYAPPQMTPYVMPSTGTQLGNTIVGNSIGGVFGGLGPNA